MAPWTPPGPDPAMAEALSSLSEQLAAAVEQLKSGGGGGGGGWGSDPRSTILRLGGQIVNTAKLPHEQWIDQCMMQGQLGALRLFVDWGVFDVIPKEGDAGITYKEIAEKVDAEEAIVRRFAWMLVSLGILRQTGTDTVHHTAKSLAYVGGSPTQRLFEINFDNVVLSTAHLPEYYRTYGRKECKSDRHTPFSFAMRCPEKDFWEIMNDDPTGKRMSIFMQAMATVEQYFPIAGMYDFSWAVEKGKEDAHKDRAQLVDVGGGKGHCVKVLLEQTEGLVPERCVLQDRPEVIEKSKAAAEGKLAEGVVLQSIDFHKEQPVKGAFTYWIRRCLHDYADAVCVNILSIIADAMADDSRLLVVEQILENPPNNFTAWNDLMINCFGGKERTLADFQTLAAGAGLKVSGVFHSKTSPMAVIEMAKSGAA